MKLGTRPASSKSVRHKTKRPSRNGAATHTNRVNEDTGENEKKLAVVKSVSISFITLISLLPCRNMPKFQRNLVYVWRVFLIPNYCTVS